MDTVHKVDFPLKKPLPEQAISIPDGVAQLPANIPDHLFEAAVAIIDMKEASAELENSDDADPYTHQVALLAGEAMLAVQDHMRALTKAEKRFVSRLADHLVSIPDEIFEGDTD